MLKIAEELRALYKTDYLPYRSDPVQKNLVITFPEWDLTIENEQIVADSFELTESICDGDELKFGACESAEIKFTVANIEQDLTGKICIIKQIVNGVYEMPLGTYKIDSCKRQADRIFKDCVGYDMMQLLDVDVLTWYNSLPFPMTVKAMRESLCNYCDIPCEQQELINDNVVIKKTINPTALNGRDVMKYLCEFNATFGHITRENKFKCISLSGIALYPAETLYPEENLYPAESAEYLGVAGYMDSEYEDYYCRAIDQLTIKQKEADFGATVGVGNNPYTIQGNFFLYGKGNDELSEIAENIFLQIRNKYYRPHKTNMPGLPYLEVGDSVSIIASNDVIETFIFKRTLTGIQALKDEISATGYEYRQDKAGLQLQLQLADERTADLEEYVEIEKEVTEKQLSDLQEGLNASRDLINKYLFEGHRYETENATYFVNAGNVTDATKFMIISLGGIGFGTKAAGQSIETAAYTTAWDINGNFNANYIRSGVIQGVTLISQGYVNGFLNTITLEGGRISLNCAENISATLDTSRLYLERDGSIFTSVDAGNVLVGNSSGAVQIAGPYINGGVPITTSNKNSYTFNATPNSLTSLQVVPVNPQGTYIAFSGIQAASTAWVSSNFQRIGASDFRLKKEIMSIGDIKDLYMSFKPKSYRFKDATEDNKVHNGLLAQEVVTALKRAGLAPEEQSLVEEYDCRAYKEEGLYAGKKAYRINYENLHAYHMSMIQQQQKEIDELKQQLALIQGGDKTDG